MRVALFQQNLVWGDVSHNLQTVETWLRENREPVDLVVLPEMFATGFGVDLTLSEDSNRIIQNVRSWSRTYDCAFAFTVMVEDQGAYYNRAFFLSREVECHYDKRHLFRIGLEGKMFTAGTERVIVEYKGWRILLQTCYDLRFPVFSRNVQNEYDMAVYMANWPIARIAAWRILLQARAVENVSYICGVNVVGVDTNGYAHGGHSLCVDMKGRVVVELPEVEPKVEIVELNKEDLERFRMKFPVWKDADEFCLKSLRPMQND